jgi:hypothetical protein
MWTVDRFIACRVCLQQLRHGPPPLVTQTDMAFTFAIKLHHIRQSGGKNFS